MTTDSKTNMEGERQAFDQQILERVRHGHVPDLRYDQRNEWFYNNVWRDPEYVKMSFVENLSVLERHLHRSSKILEVGCGPGHMSLELARRGHHVTGIDLSPACIQVARQTLESRFEPRSPGSVRYHVGDFLEMVFPDAPFDAVLFYGSLSHFPDLDRTLDKTAAVLAPEGRILLWDTSVDHYETGDAAIMYLIRSLLSHTGHYYKKEEIAQGKEDLEVKINEVLQELKYLDPKGKKVQSPHDNSQTYRTIMAALASRFDQVFFSWESCFYRNMIGGLRFSRPEEEHRLARFIKLMEGYLMDNHLLHPAFFYYVGTKK